jgi:large subunit ribosomal protein L7/L12
MSLTNEQVVEHLGHLSVMQLCELTRELETKWGVKAVPPAAEIPLVEPGLTDKAQVEQTEFAVVLQSVEAAQKIAGIKVVREVMGLTLAEAKTLIEGLPKTLKEGLSKAEADEILAKFVAVGVKATVQ